MAIAHFRDSLNISVLSISWTKSPITRYNIRPTTVVGQQNPLTLLLQQCQRILKRVYFELSFEY